MERRSMCSSSSFLRRIRRTSIWSLARIARPARHEEFVEGPRKCAEAQEVVDHIGRYEREYL
jgi:hypothetical protein